MGSGWPHHSIPSTMCIVGFIMSWWVGHSRMQAKRVSTVPTDSNMFLVGQVFSKAPATASAGSCGFSTSHARAPQQRHGGWLAPPQTRGQCSHKYSAPLRCSSGLAYSSMLSNYIWSLCPQRASL